MEVSYTIFSKYYTTAVAHRLLYMTIESFDSGKGVGCTRNRYESYSTEAYLLFGPETTMNKHYFT